ncbi:nicotinamide-nucleotide amidohydrolase family protein [Anaerococcus urinomassiliensis]|uniref:nicotinamide-nucleotide amidohydrolase family protein n=1 Tax=Anaerococcus urinomassiliensis TaxID=1745712 RepID=UPI00093BDD0E|nr:nicotinamide-nucleotide amidohydrolase family protein [Anaerococcus urinomassiliensis]
MDAQIFSIGTEILLGNIVDTNSKFIAEKLRELGINLYKMETIGDNFNRLVDAFKNCDGTVDFVIASGGLGPTPDDLTKEAIIEALGLESEIHEESYNALIEYFNGSKKKADENIKQAMFPKEAIVLKNPAGTAPGGIFTSKKGTKYIIMPGPPNEMELMFTNELMKHLPRDAYMKSVFAQIALLGEWEMAQKIDLDREKPTISPYITNEGPVLRITAKDKCEEEVDKQIRKGIEIVKENLSTYLITCDDMTKEEVLINLLKDKGEYISTAESITGGLIASSIIDIPGASDVLKESYIVYSNQAKEKLLNVSCETIKKYDVVSEEVLVQMLDGLYQMSQSELCIATTGYAHKGQVYLGILYKGKKYTKHLQLNGDRNRVRLRTKNHAIDMAILIMRGVYESNISI